MTPRQEIANQILETKSGDITKTLKPFAIGKWVPVSERLPEFDDGQFMGWIRFNDGTLENDLYSDCMINDYASHWLELDMPEVGE